MKKLKYILILLCIITSIIFTGCNKKGFEGEICELEFKPAYDTVLLLPITIYNGKTTTIILVPYIRHYPDRYYVKVRHFNDKDQKYNYDDCYVPKDVFDELDIGDWFVFDPNNYFDSEPYTQEKQ